MSKGTQSFADKCLSFCQLGDCLLPLLARGTISKVDTVCSHLCSCRPFCFTPVVEKINALSLCMEKFFVHSRSFKNSQNCRCFSTCIFNITALWLFSFQFKPTFCQLEFKLSAAPFPKEIALLACWRTACKWKPAHSMNFSFPCTGREN